MIYRYSLFRKIKKLIGFIVHGFLIRQNTECKSPRMGCSFPTEVENH